MDTGFISLKRADYERGIKNFRENSLLPGQQKIEVIPMFEMSDPVVVEWRALTTAYLDIVVERVRSTLRMSKKSLSLSQLLEGGTTSVRTTIILKKKNFILTYTIKTSRRLEKNLQKFRAPIHKCLPSS